MKPSKPRPPKRDQQLDTLLRRWFKKSARPLPWRTDPRDPYRSLLSEVMLQQTQVSRVIPQFERFTVRFPTIQDLAAAPEPDVLALWSGMGYYQRARNLHAAAQQIVSDHRGQIPSDTAALRTLKGIGRYTAGAIASIVFNRPEPIVDGNIARVLMRLDAQPLAHASPEAMTWSWSRAAALVSITRSPAHLNEGLMELGATICTPRNPRCDACPLRNLCTARAKSQQHQIPRPKDQAPRKTIHCAVAILTNNRGQLLLERRPSRGMWAGLWQAPTLEAITAIDRVALATSLGLRTLKPAGEFTHTTTHRQVRFCIYTGKLPARAAKLLDSRLLANPADLDTLALGAAQRRAIELGLKSAHEGRQHGLR